MKKNRFGASSRFDANRRDDIDAIADRVINVRYFFDPDGRDGRANEELEDVIGPVFERCGIIDAVQVWSAKRFVFITYATPQEARRAITEFDGSTETEGQSGSRSYSTPRAIAVDLAIRDVMYRQYKFPRKPHRLSPAREIFASSTMGQRPPHFTPPRKLSLKSRLQSDIRDEVSPEGSARTPPSGPRAMRLGTTMHEVKVERRSTEPGIAASENTNSEEASTPGVVLSAQNSGTTIDVSSPSTKSSAKRPLEDPELPPSARQRRQSLNETDQTTSAMAQRAEDLDSKLKKANNQAESYEAKWKNAQDLLRLSNSVSNREKCELKTTIDIMEIAAETKRQEVARLEELLGSRTKELDVVRGDLSLVQLEVEEVRAALSATTTELEALQKALENVTQQLDISKSENMHRKETAHRLRNALEDQAKQHQIEVEGIKAQSRRRIRDLEDEIDRARAGSSTSGYRTAHSSVLYDKVKNLEAELARNVEWRRDLQRQLEQERAGRLEAESEVKALGAVPSIMELARRIGQITDKVAVTSSSGE
ncbi:hypothetical protein FRC03_009939 [Tulasnella sp. 419]|nr:hypothetical protein FRC03_009939 [Tulasnella sp. 419]